CVAARVAAWRASQSRWAPHLQEALAVSAAIAALVPRVKHARDSGPATGADNGRIGHDLMPSLWETVAEPPARHPAGHAPVATYHQGRGCVDCAWSFIQRRRLRCRHAPNIPLPDDAPACARFEPAEELDCQSCGACCREAYDAVELTGCER